MRLTLRTVLAYLDGNLEPDDAEDIGKKIEESEFATRLVHTIRDCTQRARLGCPPLIGRGLGADPNTVAEYLEYRLADERVPEFERICLASETNLAEVASCHQILTLVLGEPAEIDPQTRDRLYALAAQADAPPLQSDAMHGDSARGESIRQAVAAPVAAPPAGAAVPPVVRRPKPEVPEYLRESRWPIWPLVAMILVAASLTFAGLFFFGPAPFRESVTALVTPPSEPEQQAVDGAKLDDDVKDAAKAEPAEDASAAPAGDEAPAATGEPAATAPVDEPAPAQDVEPAPLEPADAAPADPSLARPAGDPAAEPDATAPLPPEPGPLDGAASRETSPPEPLPTSPLAPLPGDDMPAEPMPLDDAPGATDEAPAGDPRRAPAEGFGRFTTNTREVLLKFDPALADWVRLGARSPLNKGDRLMSLPLFQPMITLSSNISIQADGAAEFELVGWSEQNTPIMAVLYGRLLMDTVGRAGNSLRLQIDGQDPLITFVDPESTLALDVYRELPPGKNPEAGPALLVANLYATSGVIRVTKADGVPTELQAPAMFSLTGGPDEKPRAGQFPAWVTGDELSELDRRAASDVDTNLAPDKSAGLQLRELIDPQHKLSRKREVQTLAIRSLAHLGDFNPAIAALNNADLKNSWPAVVAELKAAIANSPETAARVRGALEKQRGEENGRGLYRMLWGYSTSDLQTGAGRELLDALNRNDALDFRVLAILNLQELAGGATHGYHPEEADIKRRIPAKTWEGRIGKLVPRPASGAAPRSRTSTPPAS